MSAGILETAKKQGIQVTEKEGINIIVNHIIKATEEFRPAFDAPIMGFDAWLANSSFREAVRRYNKETMPFLEKYGTSDRYAVLYLDPKASLDEIVTVSKQLETNLHERKQEFSILLLANDDVIKRHESELQARGFDFSPNWREPNSTYKRMLKAAEKFGRTYKMEKNHSGWAYTQQN